MKSIFLIALMLLTGYSFGQHGTVDRSDSTLIVVQDYSRWQDISYMPATSAIYMPPCIYRNVNYVKPETVDSSRLQACQFKEFVHVKRDGKHGIITKTDTIIIPLEYDTIVRLTATFPKAFQVKSNGKWGLLNCKADTVIPFEYDAMTFMNSYDFYSDYYGSMNSILVEKDGKKGLMRTDGAVKLSCKYDYINVSCKQIDCPIVGEQYMVGIDGKRGYINVDESVAIDINYESVSVHGYSSLIKFKLNGKVGLMDTLQKVVLEPDYEEIIPYYRYNYQNLMGVKKNGKWGMIQGPFDSLETVIPIKYDFVKAEHGFRDHFVLIENGKWGLIDSNANVVVEPIFEQIDAMEDGNFAYKENGRWGFMNSKGYKHCSPRYDTISDNYKNWCLVMKNDRYGFCNTAGKQIAEPIYGAPIWDDYIHWDELVYAGRIALSKYDANGECVMGVIDSTGRVLLPFRYGCYDELVYNFGSTLIARRNGKDVLLDGDGKEIYCGDYDRIERQRKGKEYFIPMKGDKMGLVSPYGKLISTPKYDDIIFDWFGGEGDEHWQLFFHVHIDGKVGLLDSNGRQLIAPTEKEIDLVNVNQAMIIGKDKVGLYNFRTKKYEDFDPDQITSFNGHVGVFYGSRGNRYFINKKGERLNDKTYQFVYRTGPNQKYFEVKRDYKIGICDSLGQEIFEPKFNKIKFWDGTFGAGKIANRYCFFDSKGDTLVGYRYEKVKGVFGDNVCVRINDKFGVVTRKGETVIEPTLQTKLNFVELKEFGLTPIRQNYKDGAINERMEVVMPPDFSSIYVIRANNESYMMAYKDGSMALYDKKGKALTSHQYSKYEISEVGELFLFNDLFWYRLNENGEVERTER